MAKLDRLGWAAGLAFVSHGVRVGVRANTPRALELARASLPMARGAARSPVVQGLYSLVVAEDQRPGLRPFHLLYLNASRLARSHDLSVMSETLQASLLGNIVLGAPRRVFLRGRVVAWKQGAILVVGTSGEPTDAVLTTFQRAGGRLLADPLVALDANARAYAAGLSVRDATGETADGPPWTSPSRPAGIRAIAIVRGASHSSRRARAATPAQAMLALLEHTPAARLRPEFTLEILQGIAERAPAVEGAPDAVARSAAQMMERLFVDVA